MVQAEEAVSLREGARILSVTPNRFARIAAAAPIRRVELPGVVPRYVLEDICRLLEQSIVSTPRAKPGER